MAPWPVLVVYGSLSGLEISAAVWPVCLQGRVPALFRSGPKAAAPGVHPQPFESIPVARATLLPVGGRLPYWWQILAGKGAQAVDRHELGPARHWPLSPGSLVRLSPRVGALSVLHPGYPGGNIGGGPCTKPRAVRGCLPASAAKGRQLTGSAHLRAGHGQAVVSGTACPSGSPWAAVATKLWRPFRSALACCRPR